MSLETQGFRCIKALSCQKCIPKTLLDGNYSVKDSDPHAKTHIYAHITQRHIHTHLQSTNHQISSSSLDSVCCCTALESPSSTTGQLNYGKSLGKPHKLGIAIKTKYNSFVLNECITQQANTYLQCNPCKDYTVRW